MADVEKVIRGLEACRNEDCIDRICPYATEECCMELLCHDALILLRELAREEDDGK